MVLMPSMSPDHLAVTRQNATISTDVLADDSWLHSPVAPI